MACRACWATRRATWARGAKKKARRLPGGSRRVVKGSLRLGRSTATVKAEAAGEQTEDDQDDPDQGVAENERNNPDNDQQSASTEVHPAPPFLRNAIASPTIKRKHRVCEGSELKTPTLPSPARGGGKTSWRLRYDTQYQMTRVIKTLLAVTLISILLAACGAPAGTRSG